MKSARMDDLVVQKVRAFAEELLPSMGLELFDVQFRREGHGWVLRLYIDREDGVSLDDCSMVSRELSDYLDVEDIIEQSYHLEVSSPGLERPLRNLDEFKRFRGRKARIKLRESIGGQRVFVGEISQVHDDQRIELILENNEPLMFSYDQVRTARLSM
jgi:ribosome maturation factor RimP